MGHNKYSQRLYFHLSERDLTALKAAHIGTQTFSDHAPTSIALRLHDRPAKPCIWRLNPTLLTDPSTMTHISETIYTYFHENTTDGVSPLSIWEAHKCVLRGELISLASQLKRESEKELQTLVAKISQLET